MCYDNIDWKKAGVVLLYNIRQVRLQSRENYQQWRGRLHNGERVNSSRKHNNPQCIGT